MERGYILLRLLSRKDGLILPVVGFLKVFCSVFAMYLVVCCVDARKSVVENSK